MSIPHIPVIRRGQPYESLDRVKITSIRTGEPVAEISQANAGMIRRDMRRPNRDAFRSLTVVQLLDLCSHAGDLFMGGTLPLGTDGRTQTSDEYVDSLSHTSGLPHALVRRNMGKIHQVFSQMPTVLKGLTRGLDPEVIDSGFGTQAGVPVSYFATTDALGVVLPSNSPGVNSLWMPAVALKVPVVLKPGREEPWTPYRVIQAFIAAGAPPEAFSFYPTDHEGSGAVMDTCGRALIFGDESTVQRYAGNPGVQVHGPGRSKVLIGDDMVERWPEFVDLIAASIAENSGRSCINASAILTPRYGDEIAAAVAERLAQIEPKPAEDPDAKLAGFANPKMAEYITAALDDGLGTPGAEDVTARYRSGERSVSLDGCTYLRPTIVRCDSWEHPLANREFLFPYASVVEMPQSRMLEQMGPSLVVTALTEDPAWTEALIGSPLIDRLNLGPLPTSRVEWDQPHEGNLFEFLYRRRAIQRSAF
ncbi:MAG: aldehyde dehydrogenase family protein [Armatimonadota bacterium]